MTDQDLARKFHDVYERLAPSFGYATRDDTKQFDPETPNGRLMTAVCREMRAAIAQATPTMDDAIAAGVDKSPPSDAEVASIISKTQGNIERAVTLAYRRVWVAAPVALRSVELERDTAGMCTVKINGRVAIRDNGDIIGHMATLDWFAPPEAPAPIAAEPAQEEWREDSYNAVKIWAGAEDLMGDGPNLYGYNIARQHVREILKTLHEDLHEWLRCDNCGMDMRGHDRMGHCFERASTESAAPIAPPEWVKAVQEAYGWLWHVNNEPMAPVPMWSPEQAAYEARKNLRDLLTKEQRGEAINAVSGLVSGLLENKASAATQAESAAPIAPVCPMCRGVGSHGEPPIACEFCKLSRLGDEYRAATQASAPEECAWPQCSCADQVDRGCIAQESASAPQVDAPHADLRDALLRALVEAAYMQAGDERQIALWRCAKATRAALAQAQQQGKP